MKRNLGKMSLMFTALAAAAIGAGCGGNGATNNDQGMSVTLLGFFDEPATGCGDLPTSLTGLIVPLGEAQPEPVDGSTAGSTGAGLKPSSSVAAVLGVQNNLFKQYFRADRVLLDYYVPGATAQPPSTNVPFSVFVAPPQDPANGGNGRLPVSGALPPTFDNSCNRSFVQTAIVPPSVREWLNFNRDSLPEPPFQLEVTARVGGMSSSGRYYTTNAEVLYVEVVPETLVTPSEGSDGTTTGGLTGSESAVTTDTSTTGEDTTTDTGNGLDGLSEALPEGGNSGSGNTSSGDL